jgi:alkaline phosphatase D
VPSQPDAWVWLGDFAYLDEPDVDCNKLPTHADCTCTGDWLHIPPYQCLAGDVDHALARWRTQLTNPDYMAFLEFMCPGSLAKGLFPPPGTDPQACPRAIVVRQGGGGVRLEMCVATKGPEMWMWGAAGDL